MTGRGTPSWAANIASCRYGISTRLTTNPGALRHGTGSLSSRRANDKAPCITWGSVLVERTISMSGIWDTGLKKCRPTRRPGRASCCASGSNMRLEVLVANSASGFIRGSRLA